MKRLKDLREYLDSLSALDDLREIDDEIDPVLEVGAAARYSYENSAPALLLNNLPGSGGFCRILAAPLGLSSVPDNPLARVALSLGLSTRATAQEIIQALVDARLRPLVPPVVVDSAPCKENILLGTDVDLDQFPAPVLHDRDGGAYLNTWGTIIVSTPDRSFTNWSIARVMKIDDRHMTGSFFSLQHQTKLWREWSDQGKDMPYAIVQGTEPAVPLVSGMPLPDDIEEVGFLGAYFGAPVELVKCETNDLLVPASAEIVIEGHVSISERAVEGPMGEHSGYVARHSSMQPVYTVEAITYRDNPIWPVSVAGEPVDETDTGWALPAAAEACHQLRAAGLPVSTAWMPLESAAHWLVVIVPNDWRERLPGADSTELCLRISQALSSARVGLEAIMTRVFVLDDDIDPSNLQELTWAIATRVSPGGGHIIRDGAINPLAGCYSEAERRLGYGPKAVLNGLLPPPGQRNSRSSFRYSYPPAVRDKITRILRENPVGNGSRI